MNLGHVPDSWFRASGSGLRVWGGCGCGLCFGVQGGRRLDI